MLLKLIRWTLGYVTFSIRGREPERFLNFAARGNLCLWDMEKKGAEQWACVTVRDYKKLRPFARKSGVCLRVQKRTGFPFFVRKYKEKRGLLYGAGAAAVVLVLLSMRIWSIDVVGNEMLSVYDIKQAAAECGLYQGMLKKDLDAQVIRQRLMARFPEIGWVAINTWGNTVTIRMDEGDPIPEVEDAGKFSNVLSKKNGQIVRMDVYHGTAQVQVGDAVAEGELLISGVQTTEQGEESFVHAAAKIIARTRRVFSIDIPLNQVEEKPNGAVVVRRSLDLFGADLPLSLQGEPEGNYRRTVESKPLVLNGIPLPVTLHEETFTMQDEVSVTLTQEQARARAIEELTKKQAEVLKDPLEDGKVLSYTEEAALENGVYTLRWDCVCEENIAKEQELFFENAG